MWYACLSDSDGRTPLIWAVDRGNLSAVEILVAKGAEINGKVCLPFSIIPVFLLVGIPLPDLVMQRFFQY